MSAASPPAITVNVPFPEAGGPPETGASIQPAPVISRSRCANEGAAQPIASDTEKLIKLTMI
jgi:hypothetical protein